MPVTEDKEWMRPADLAAWLDLPVRTIYSWRYRGIGPRGAVFGRHVRYRRSDVENWVDAQYENTARVGS